MRKKITNNNTAGKANIELSCDLTTCPLQQQIIWALKVIRRWTADSNHPSLFIPNHPKWKATQTKIISNLFFSGMFPFRSFGSIAIATPIWQLVLWRLFCLVAFPFNTSKSPRQRSFPLSVRTSFCLAPENTLPKLSIQLSWYHLFRVGHSLGA